jgi:hypothetical protein
MGKREALSAIENATEGASIGSEGIPRAKAIRDDAGFAQVQAVE